MLIASLIRYGFGGPCFPRDGRALAEVARQVATVALPLDTALVEAPARANVAHALFQSRWLIERADLALRRAASEEGGGSCGGGGGGGGCGSSCGEGSLVGGEGGVGARARAHRCVIVFDDVTFKPGLGVPLVLESQKLVVAQQVIASDRLGDGL
jgi:hypothetical protein